MKDAEKLGIGGAHALGTRYDSALQNPRYQKTASVIKTASVKTAIASSK
jgi:hypothetical protein